MSYTKKLFLNLKLLFVMLVVFMIVFQISFYSLCMNLFLPFVSAIVMENLKHLHSLKNNG